MRLACRLVPVKPFLMYSQRMYGRGVRQAICSAERLLPGKPAPDGELDPRWQAIIRVGEFIKSNPDEVWEFALRWGKHAHSDVRAAVATCLLEHLLEHHFAAILPRVREAAEASRRFADTLRRVWYFGQAADPANRRTLARLIRKTER